MDSILLNAAEARVLGSLVEKEITTPDYCPLTLNALTNACNQSSNRDPVVAFDEATVVRTLDLLREKKLAVVFSGAESRVPKYRHKFAETFGLTKPETAVLCELMLRGPQTVGELRGRTARLHEFSGLDGVETVLQGLAAREPHPFVIKLPRQPGFKESRYAHLLSGEIKIESPEPAPRLEPATVAVRLENERLAKLEAEIAALRGEITGLKQQFADFRKQFE